MKKKFLKIEKTSLSLPYTLIFFIINKHNLLIVNLLKYFLININKNLLRE